MNKETVVAEDLHLRLHPDLRRMIEAEADAAMVTMNDVAHRILATYYKRKDLVIAPKKRMGRPRKQLVNGA